MNNLPPPPIREQNQNSLVWQVWYRKISEFLSTNSFPWTFVSKIGSNLTDIETREHAALQSVLGSGSHHLSETEHTDLTDGGNTVLHKHTHNLQDGLQGGGADDLYHLTLVQHTDLTDAGDSALHYHATDRDRANHTGTQTLSTISDAGDSAGLDVGTTAGTVAAGDDSRFLSTTDKTDLTDGGKTTLHTHDIGSVQAGVGLVLVTTSYIQVDIGGVTYKLALVT